MTNPKAEDTDLDLEEFLETLATTKWYMNSKKSNAIQTSTIKTVEKLR